MKEETTKQEKSEKLLSPKGAIVFSEHNRTSEWEKSGKCIWKR